MSKEVLRFLEAVIARHDAIISLTETSLMFMKKGKQVVEDQLINLELTGEIDSNIEVVFDQKQQEKVEKNTPTC